MRYLIDTNVLIWLTHDKHKLQEKTLQLLEDPHSDLVISIASLWEMTIKQSLGKLQLAEGFFDRISGMDNDILPITMPHLHALLLMPYHHKDPFDRLLVAQAMAEKLTLVTLDEELAHYGVSIVSA